MNQLEQNNLNAQVALMESIISNYGTITYSVTSKGQELFNLLTEAKSDPENKSVTIDVEKFNTIMKIARIIQQKDRWDELTSISGDALKENRIKSEVLALLQSKTTK